MRYHITMDIPQYGHGTQLPLSGVKLNVQQNVQQQKIGSLGKNIFIREVRYLKKIGKKHFQTFELDVIVIVPKVHSIESTDRPNQKLTKI
jgi:hypothetical protein